MFSHDAENKTIRGFAVKYLIKWKLQEGLLTCSIIKGQNSSQVSDSKTFIFMAILEKICAVKTLFTIENDTEVFLPSIGIEDGKRD